MKKLKNNCWFLLRLWLLIAFILSFPASSIFADQPEACSVVFTFDPPFLEDQNLTDSLFARIRSVLGNNDQSHSLAASINSQGGTWLLSKNLSGIQLAILYPEKSNQIIEAATKFTNALASITTNLPHADSGQTFIQKLIARSSEAYLKNGHDHISIETYGLSLDSYYLLQKSLEQLKSLYWKNSSAGYGPELVIANTSPAIVNILSWNEISAHSFFSAKFIGEKYLSEISSSGKPDYEIIFQPGKIILYLVAEGNEAELFNYHPRISDFCNQLGKISSSNDWKLYSKSAEQILIEDSRDLGKTLLQKAWLKHWHSDLKNESINFSSPATITHLVSMPTLHQHYFCRNDEEFPRIIAARSEDRKNLTDVAIRLIAEKRIIDEIIKTFDADQSLSFPLSMRRNDDQILMIQFHTANDTVPRAITGIRSRILNHLALKNLVNDLPLELSVSIAATSNISPFLLRGMIQQGWPGDPAAYSWRLASNEDLGEVLGVSPEDTQTFRRRWLLRTITPKSRAEILSELISKGLYVKSFELN